MGVGEGLLFFLIFLHNCVGLWWQFMLRPCSGSSASEKSSRFLHFREILNSSWMHSVIWHILWRRGEGANMVANFLWFMNNWVLGEIVRRILLVSYWSITSGTFVKFTNMKYVQILTWYFNKYCVSPLRSFNCVC